ISRHDSVFDAVVYHLNEVTRAVRSAVQVSLLCSTAGFLASRRSWNIARTRRQDCEYRIKMLDYSGLAADHHTVAAIQSPNTPAGSHVDIMDLLRCEFGRAPDIVDVVGISTVDEDVIRLQQRCEL